MTAQATGLDAIALSAYSRLLATAHDEFAEIGQQYAGVGMFDEAEVAHDRAMLVLTAYENEATDKEPPGPCECQTCSALYARACALAHDWTYGPPRLRYATGANELSNVGPNYYVCYRCGLTR